jgi:hypothetical protein
MIDPVTIGLAVAGAKQAVSFIKEAINVGHDIASMGKELGQFFTSQAEVEAAAKEAESARKDPKKAGDKSATAMAMDCVLRAEELRAAEQELKNMFAMQGKLDMYNRMCKIRYEIIQSREKVLREERRAIEAKKERRRRFFQGIQDLFVGLFVASFVWSTFVGIIYLVVFFVTTWHKWYFCIGPIICRSDIRYYGW